MPVGIQLMAPVWEDLQVMKDNDDDDEEEEEEEDGVMITRSMYFGGCMNRKVLKAAKCVEAGIRTDRCKTTTPTTIIDGSSLAGAEENVLSGPRSASDARNHHARYTFEQNLEFKGRSGS
eukprot:jgi/Bigna1/137565/aug1.40_g12273